MNTESQQCKAFCTQLISEISTGKLVLAEFAAVFHFFWLSLVQQGAASPAIDAVQGLLPQIAAS